MTTPQTPSSAPQPSKLSAAASKALPGYVGGALTSGQAAHAARADSGNYDVVAGGATIGRASSAPTCSPSPVAQMNTPSQPGEAARVSRGPAIAVSAVGARVSGGQAVNPRGGK